MRIEETAVHSGHATGAATRPWTATASGGMWPIFDHAPGDVRLFDIASGLSRTCRYNGQLRRDVEFYSVAEHSALMTRWLLDRDRLPAREDALKVLLHDAAEAILGDMVSPIKKILPDFQHLEARTQAVIEEAFGLQHARIPALLIKHVDRRIRLDEREALIEDPALTEGRRIAWEGDPGLSPLGVRIEGLLPFAARRLFLQTFLDCCRLPLRNPENRDLHAPFLAEASKDLGTGEICEFRPGPA